jgi:hypothetical protein
MVEGFSLCIIVSCFLIVMSVILSSRVQTAIWLVYISHTRVVFVAHSHYIGTKVSREVVLGWPQC